MLSPTWSFQRVCSWQVLASLVMLAGSFLWAGVVAVFVNASQRAPESIEFQSTVDQLNSFMAKHDGAPRSPLPKLILRAYHAHRCTG